MLLKIYRFFISLLPIAYMAIIWLQSSYFNPNSIGNILTMVNSSIILVIGTLLELAHLIEFGILYFFIVVVFLCYGPLNKRKEFIAIIISVLYGLTDEIHQIFVPFRSFSLIDLLKDSIGVLAIWFLIHKIYYAGNDTRFSLFLKGISAAFNSKK